MAALAIGIPGRGGPGCAASKGLKKGAEGLRELLLLSGTARVVEVSGGEDEQLLG
jgi:hypothetical protein